MFALKLAILLALCQYIDMVCIYCGGNTRVTNSRPQVRSNQVWRRRQCNKCGALFSTTEKNDPGETLVVKVDDGNQESFLIEKLFLSIYESMKYRKNAVADAKYLTQTVINKLSHSTNNGVIDSKLITKAVLVSLNRFDKIAASHYLAFHSN